MLTSWICPVAQGAQQQLQEEHIIVDALIVADQKEYGDRVKDMQSMEWWFDLYRMEMTFYCHLAWLGRQNNNTFSIDLQKEALQFVQLIFPRTFEGPHWSRIVRLKLLDDTMFWDGAKLTSEPRMETHFVDPSSRLQGARLQAWLVKRYPLQLQIIYSDDKQDRRGKTPSERLQAWMATDNNWQKLPPSSTVTSFTQSLSPNQAQVQPPSSASGVGQPQSSSNLPQSSGQQRGFSQLIGPIALTLIIGSALLIVWDRLSTTKTKTTKQKYKRGGRG